MFAHVTRRVCSEAGGRPHLPAAAPTELMQPNNVRAHSDYAWRAYTKDWRIYNGTEGRWERSGDLMP
jgi:hypothetical protein